MARTTKQTRTKAPATPGFAIEIKDDTELGLAILNADFSEHYEPVAVVVSISEASEIADSDRRRRMKQNDRGTRQPVPTHYTVWARGLEGTYCIARKIVL